MGERVHRGDRLIKGKKPMEEATLRSEIDSGYMDPKVRAHLVECVIQGDRSSCQQCKGTRAHAMAGDLRLAPIPTSSAQPLFVPLSSSVLSCVQMHVTCQVCAKCRVSFALIHVKATSISIETNRNRFAYINLSSASAMSATDRKVKGMAQASGASLASFTYPWPGCTVASALKRKHANFQKAWARRHDV